MSPAQRRWLRAFLEPILPEEVPELTQGLANSTSKAIIGCFAVGTLVHASDLLRGRGDLLPTLALWLGMGVLTFALVGALRTDWGAERAEWMAAIISLATVGEIIATGPINSGFESTPFLGYVASLPLIFSSLLPWRPRFPLVLGVLGAIVTGLVARLGYDIAWDVVELRMLLCIAISMVAAAAVQIRRQQARELERAKERARLVATDRLAHLGRLSGALAHEVKTPLATVLNQLSMARSLGEELSESIGHAQVTDDDLREIATENAEILRATTEAAERAARLVQSMREQTRTAGPGSRARFPVVRRVEASILLLRGRLRTTGIEVEIQPTDVELWGTPLQFDQVITNLLRNAIDAMEQAGQGSRIVISTEAGPKGVLLAIQDDGPGVPEALRESIFEQGFSTKGGDRGLGLGLWLCRNLLQSGFGGELRLADSPPPGARFECWFPDRSGASAREDAERASP